MNETAYQIAIKELEASTEDIQPADIVLFSEPLGPALYFVNRIGRFSLTEFTEKLEFTRAETKKILDVLVKRNLFVVSKFSTVEETIYESHPSAPSHPSSGT